MREKKLRQWEKKVIKVKKKKSGKKIYEVKKKKGEKCERKKFKQKIKIKS